MSESFPIPRTTLVDTVGLRIQELHASGQLPGDQPLLRIDNRDQASQAPFQLDAARGLLHRTGCRAIPPGSRSALYGVWEIGAEDPALACPRCNPVVRPEAKAERKAEEARPHAEARPEARQAEAKLQDEHSVDLLYGLLSIVSQFGGVLRERGQEYRRSRAGSAIGARIDKIYSDVNERERRVLDVLTASLDTVAAAIRDIEGGINGERTNGAASRDTAQSDAEEPTAGRRPDEAR